MNLEAFRNKVSEYRRAVGIPQKELAQTMGLHPIALSYKLNGTNNLRLTHPEIKQIVKMLAEWKAINTREEAVELLELMGLRPTTFTPQEWSSAPLNNLEITSPTGQEATISSVGVQTAPGRGAATALPVAEEECQECKSNLPAQPTPFIGRGQEAEQASALLRRSDVRLLTLSGPGGIGKTRLGLEVAARVCLDFEHGVFLVGLSPISDPALVATTIAYTLGVKETGGKSLLECLKDYLRNKTMLLLLDNFEQVIEAAAVVSELMAVAPRLKVLVTSRILLHLYGEYEFVVPSLALPDPKALPALEQLTQYAAVDLFVQRARAVRADFALTAENAPAITEICARLDGLPLAIELAAARSKVLSPQDLLARLKGSFGHTPLQLLTGGGRDLPARQQTLRNTIDWSYQALSDSEKALFERLAVFVDGWSLDAAEAVCGKVPNLEINSPHPSSLIPHPSIDVLEGLASLLDKSMIYKQEVFGEAESADERFNMLKVLRDYALERLGQDGQEEFYRQQHASYYLNLAETAERELKGPQQVVWLERLETEHDNLRAALSWTLQKAEITSQKSEEISSSLIPHPSSLQSPHPSSLIPHPLEMAVRFGAVLWRFWQLHSHLSEGRQWLEAILERVKAAETAGSNAVPLALQAKLLHGTGLLAYYQGQHMQAVEYLEQSLAISRELGDKNGIILALQHLGLVNLYQGEAAQATGLFEEVLALRKELKDKRGIALTLNDLGNAARQAGKFERADELLGESLKLFEELGNKEGIAIAHRNLGHVAYQRGDFEQARTIFETGLNLFRELGSKASVAQIMQGLAGVAARQGRAEEASRLWQEAQELLASTGAISDPEMQLEYSRAVAKAKTPEKPTGQQTDSVKNQPAVATGPARTVPHPQNESAGGSTFGLTNRELEVLRLVAQGLTNAQVAENLVVAPRTVNVHLTSIYTKLRVNSRTAATRYAIEQRLV